MNPGKWLAMLALLVSGGAAAQGAYIGLTAGIVDVDIAGVDEATNAGLLLGYDVYDHEVFHVSAEVEFTTTVSDGDLTASGRSGGWDIDTQAAYLAFRLGEPVYIRTRFGYLRNDISANINQSSLDDSDSGGSWGAAIGWMAGDQWALEAGSVLIEADIYYWSLGAQYHF